LANRSDRRRCDTEVFIELPSHRGRAKSLQRRIPEVATESKGSGAVIVQSVRDADLVGTVHDPLICVDAKPPSEEERLARAAAELKEKRARPIRVASFEIE
jgi:hypothetical protein